MSSAIRGVSTVTIVNVADKTTHTLYRHRGNIGRPRWMPDGKGLLVPLDTLLADRAQIWYIAYPSGAATRFTNDLTDYSRFHFDRTADGKTLAIVSESPLFNLEVVDPETGSSRPLTTGGTGGGLRTMTWGGSGTLYYTLGQNIFRRDLQGFGLVEMVISAAIIFVPFVYLIANGALDWGPVNRIRAGLGTRTVTPRTTESSVRRVGNRPPTEEEAA